MKVAIIADDITGANDSGVQLAKSGLKTAVWLNNVQQQTVESLEAVVIDTDSRAMSEHDARESIKASLHVLEPYQPQLLFKKVDSTLRGNVGAELAELIKLNQPDYVLLTPSFPESRRTVSEGLLYVDGTPIGETEFALNEADPVKDSRIADHIGRQFKGELVEVPEELWTKSPSKIEAWLKQNHSAKGCVFICDATSSHTLKTIAQFAQGSTDQILLAGSAGLSSALTIESNGGKREVKRTKPTQPILYLIGSMSDISRKQVQHLLIQEQAVGIKMDAIKAVDEDEFVRATEFERVNKEAHAALRDQKIPVIYSGTERHEIDVVYSYAQEKNIPLSVISKRIVALLAAVGENLVQTYSFQAIIMTGGDTAKALCKRIDISQLNLIDEFETGIPISMFTGSLEGTYAITKAGAFGTEHTFSKIYQFFMEGAIK